jgi:hypothetical protein
VGTKQQCANHKKHTFTLPSNEDSPPFNGALPLSRNREKLNKQSMKTAAGFVITRHFSGRQAGSLAMHEFLRDL